ncbi:MAG: MFS transporter [Gemmatimonadetes bacterium]|nr:MFS transporter [Gemmatimonadota bacterium]
MNLHNTSRATLGSLFGGNVLFGAGLFFHAFLYNFYLQALGHSETVMGYAAASLTAGALAALLPAGKLVDRRGSRLVLLGAVLLGAVGLVTGALVTRPALVYAASVATGAGTGSWRVAGGPMLMRLTDEHSRARAFSWNVALLVGTGALWILIAGGVPQWLASTFGLSTLGAIRLTLIAGGAGTLVSLMLFALLPAGGPAAGDRVAGSGPSGEAAATAPVPLGLVLVVVLVAGWMFAPALVMPFFNIFFQRQFDLPVAQIGIIFAAAHGVTAFAIFGSGELASRLGPRRALAGWMLLFGPTLLLMAAAGSLGPVIGLYLVQGFVSPATNPLIDQILLELAPSERQGAVSSWRNAATDGSGLGGAAVGGMVLDGASFGALFVLAGIVALVAAPLLIYGLMRRRAAQPVGA